MHAARARRARRARTTRSATAASTSTASTASQPAHAGRRAARRRQAYARNSRRREGDLPRADPHAPQAIDLHGARLPADPRPEPDLHGLVLAGHAGRRLHRERRTGRSTSRRSATSSRPTRTRGSRTIFKAQQNPDGTFTYWGATGDFNLGDGGRNAIDVYKVTLPAPPTPQGGSRHAGEPPLVTGAAARRAARRARPPPGFRSVGVDAARPPRPAVSFSRAAGRKAQIDVFRQTRGSASITRLKRVKRFRGRTRSFTWNGRGRASRSGYYVVRFRIGQADGRDDLRRIALRRANGRFRSSSRRSSGSTAARASSARSGSTGRCSAGARSARCSPASGSTRPPTSSSP